MEWPNSLAEAVSPEVDPWGVAKFEGLADGPRRAEPANQRDSGGRPGRAPRRVRQRKIRRVASGRAHSSPRHSVAPGRLRIFFDFRSQKNYKISGYTRSEEAGAGAASRQAHP